MTRVLPRAAAAETVATEGVAAAEAVAAAATIAARAATGSLLQRRGDASHPVPR